MFSFSKLSLAPLVLGLFILTACTSEPTALSLDPAVDESSSLLSLPCRIQPGCSSPTYDSYLNLRYAELSNSNQLDLYVPKGDGPFPVVVWIHGGGWNSGDKANPRALYLAAQGYAVASLNYRLSPEAIFPAQIHDVKAAIRWLRANANRYDLDPNRIAAWGASAGGHLAALLGTSADDPTLEDLSMGHPEYSSQVQAVVDWYGPTDFLQMEAQDLRCSKINHDSPSSGESQLVGCAIQSCPTAVAAANPLTYVTPNDPPFLIQHGTLDCVVPPGQSVLLRDSLQAARVPVTLDLLPLQSHGGGYFSKPAIDRQVQTFLEETLEP